MRTPMRIANMQDKVLPIVRRRPHRRIELEFHGITCPQRDDAFGRHEVRKIRFPDIEGASIAFDEQLPASRMQGERGVCRRVGIESGAT